MKEYFISYYWWDGPDRGISNYVITLENTPQIKDQIDIDKIEEILSDRKNVHCKIINIQSLPIK